jgi:hypothetical protein
MSDRGSSLTKAGIPFAPKLDARSDTSDPLEKAGLLILDMVGQAASNAEARHQQAVEVSRKLSAQLQDAEGRIRDLEAKVRQHAERADRAERWLRQVGVEIEQKFFGRDEPPQPSPQELLRNQRR